MRNKFRLFLLVFCCAVCTTSLRARNALNKKELALTDSTVNYSFLVSGHFHGASTNTSGFPAGSLLANLDRINQSGALFLATTGDIFLDVTHDIPQYQKSLFSKVSMPIFNAVGNHDLSGNVYQENFGETWYSFRIKNQLFIFLDSETSDGSIKNAQLDFFKAALEQATGVKQIFIFSHRPVWAESDPQLKNIFKENTRSDFGNNYESTIWPILQKYSAHTSIYWFAGSLGGDAPASFFYHEKTPHLFYIQTAIRNLQRDGILQVNIKNDQVNFQTISLSGEPMPKLQDCNLNMWKTQTGETGFNYRLLPLYIKQMCFHRYFWYGIGYALFFVLLIYIIRKKRKRNKLA